MSTLITGSIRVDKLPKEKFVKGKDGAVYYNLTISVQDETRFGNNVAFMDSQTKEERETQLSKSKAKIPPAPKPVRISSTVLQHGDICIMINMQHNLFHGIEKDSKITQPRLIITYRKFKESV